MERAKETRKRSAVQHCPKHQGCKKPRPRKRERERERERERQRGVLERKIKDPRARRRVVSCQPCRFGVCIASSQTCPTRNCRPNIY